MKPSSRELFAALFVFALIGCDTPKGQDGSLADGIVIATTMLPAAPVAVPAALLYRGGHIIGEGTKERIYATPGTSESDFEAAICKPEGVEMRYLRCEIRHQSDDTYRSIYRFDKRVYYGHFTQDEIAVKY